MTCLQKSLLASTKLRISSSRPHRYTVVLCLCACSLSIACSDVTSPASRGLLVPPPVKDVQPLPRVQAILPVQSSTPTPPMLLAYYPWVERVLVESWINGRISVSSNPGALAVHVVNALVDYKGVWDYSMNQCDWSAAVSSQTLTWPGPGCLTSEPRYTSIEEVKDTILVGGLPSTGDANVYAKRGGTSGDPPDCGPGVPLPCNCPDGSPCHTVSGSQTLTLTPLAATIRLTTPGTTEIATKTILLPDPYNGSTRFQVSSTPATYRGITVPAQALSWTWIPTRSDSAVTAKCPVPPTTTVSNSCSVVLFEPGLMVGNARVNGVAQIDTFKVVGSQVNLTLQQTSMEPSITSPGSHYAHNVTQTIHVSVVDTAGNRIPNRVVVLSLIATADPHAGHVHSITSPVKPTGTLSVPQISTGPTGDATVTYTSPDPSGGVYIKGRSSGSGSVQKFIKVEIKDLVPYGPEIGADTVGSNAIHPINHYATAAHIAALQKLAATYAQAFPSAPRLKFNDSSLESGGLFDIAGNWQPDHMGHRIGRNTDVKTYAGCGATQILTQRQQYMILGIWYVLSPRGSDFILHEPGGSVCPHIHLIF